MNIFDTQESPRLAIKIDTLRQKWAIRIRKHANSFGLECVLLLFVAGTALGQSISNVNVSSAESALRQKLEFHLKIVGKAFGTDKDNVSVLVAPNGLSEKLVVVVDGLSKDGTVILAHFTAPDDYDPSTVIVKVGSSESEPYVLPAEALESTTTQTETTAQDDLANKYIRVYRSIIDPKDIADIFGPRIAKRFVVLQVTVANKSKDYQYLIHDMTFDLATIKKKLKIKGGGDRYEVSSADLSLLRGVAEKGQLNDKRNITLRILRGVGTVAAGFIGVTDFGASYSPSVATFNGPVTSAFSEAFPDYTINQMNRLNDSAYIANTIVPKQQSKVVAIFLPQSIFLSSEQAKKFWKDPTSLWGDVDLRKIDVFVDGNFIINVEDLVPAVTTGVILPDEMKKFQNDKSQVKGYISGNYLSGTDVKLLNQDLQGASVRLDGTPTDQRLNFIVSSDVPIAPNSVLKIGVVKKETTKEVDVQVQYTAAIPTVTKIDPSEVKQGDKDKVLTITGTNFLPGSQVLIDPPGGITVPIDVKNSNSTSLQVKITVADNAATGKRKAIVKTVGQTSETADLTIKKK